MKMGVYIMPIRCTMQQIQEIIQIVLTSRTLSEPQHTNPHTLDKHFDNIISSELVRKWV